MTDPVPDMCLNGVVFADLSYKPGAYEVRNGQSPVTIEQVKNPYTGETISGILHGSRNNRDASASGASGETAWRGVCKLLR